MNHYKILIEGGVYMFCPKCGTFLYIEETSPVDLKIIEGDKWIVSADFYSCHVCDYEFSIEYLDSCLECSDFVD